MLIDLSSLGKEVLHIAFKAVGDGMFDARVLLYRLGPLRLSFCSRVQLSFAPAYLWNHPGKICFASAYFSLARPMEVELCAHGHLKAP